MITKYKSELDDYIKQKHYRLVNSVLVYQDDELILEQYYNKRQETSRNNIKSIWKSILSICIGICLDQGRIKSLDEPVMNYLPELQEENHIYHRLITIRHLLTMSSGIYWNSGIHYHCPLVEQMFRSKNWISFITDIAMADVPGTKFVYKEWDVMLLSAVINKATGMGTYDFCDRYLYKPLDIISGRWGESPCGVAYTIIPGYEENSDLSARDLAKIGRLFLQGGMYQGKQIVSKEYVAQAIAPSKQNSGYGLLWWLFDDGYACRGYGGQEVTVIPEYKAVAVVQATPTPQSKSYGDIVQRFVRDILVMNK
ncbi:MAG: beta-lactamase [Herbinix sp.]|jgi:CubicO group peptidase (beta-lactamase class C family)|nr:beta-lactamase [Herbinix sp.]